MKGGNFTFANKRLFNRDEKICMLWMLKLSSKENFKFLQWK